ncbi:MAG TPA: hypothetical protein PKC83_15445 [Gemmatimonadaceae bacterium]|nr:hypothetical protein [Gemmatimonadaceae bacterium]
MSAAPSSAASVASVGLARWRYRRRSTRLDVILMALCALPAVAPPAAALARGDAPRARMLGPFLAHTVSATPRHFATTLLLVPSFSRQTGLACSACHFQFPQLTPFGRLFKLNGYTMTGLKTIPASGDSSARPSLSLSPIPPISAMLVASVSHVGKTPAGTQNQGAALPQEASLFLAGALTPKLGAFLQYTYSGTEASFGMDNIDIRFASHATLASRDLLYGLTLHNNPTVQDVWNTVPAWGWPFMQSEQTPASLAAPVLADAYSQNVLGLGAYGLWNQALYGEISIYRSALQGRELPLDGNASGVLKAVAPYWRVALQRDVGSGHVMIGSYGIDSRSFGSGVSGLTDRYTDVAGDAQYESRVTGEQVLLVRGSVIRERRHLTSMVDAGGADKLRQHLTALQANAAYQPSGRGSVSLGYFATTGTRDGTLFAPAAVDGSANGRPDTAGLMGEVTLNPWQNTRIGLHYTAFTKFNGASANYDGSGRRARDNNTLYLYTWLVF